MKPTSIFLSLLFPLFVFFGSQAQSAQEKQKFNQAMTLKDQTQYEKALNIMVNLLENNPDNPDYLTNTSFLYSMAGNKQATKEERMEYYNKGLDLANNAVEKAPKDGFAYYTYALALGRLNEKASTKKKIKNAKEIRKYCEKAVKYKPDLAGAYHILGRWHRTFANFNAFERGMVNTFYGGVPEGGGTFKDAAENFKKAIQNQPDYLLHIYELAVTYRDMGKTGYAKAYAEKVLEMNARTDKDKEAQAKSRKLLEELG